MDIWLGFGVCNQYISLYLYPRSYGDSRGRGNEGGLQRRATSSCISVNPGISSGYLCCFELNCGKNAKGKISREEFLNCTILIKYGLLPLFLVGGLLALLLLLMTFIPVPFMIFIGPAGALALSFLGYIILLGSAPFSIAYLTKSKQDRTHAKGLILPAKIMQFFFVFDVISIMVLSFKEGKWRKLTIAIVTVLALIFITFCIAIGVLIIKAI